MQNTKNSKILITGGHLTPAVAVIGELRKRGYSNFVWVGHKYNQQGNSELSPEFKTIELLGIRFIDLKTGKLYRKWTFNNFLSGIKQFLLIFWGLIKSMIIILRERPKLILSFGGYLAVPIVIWGKISSAKVVTHEQTIVVGLANKIIAKFSNKILVSWENSMQFFPKDKTILTGNPIRREVFYVKSNSLTETFDEKLPILLIFGGNQGSHEINTRVFDVIEKLLGDFNVIHQTGNSSVTNDHITAQELYKNLPLNFQKRYIYKDYINSTEVGEALNKADVILGRSGANNMSEFLALGKMCVLIPIPWSSHDEQTKNANLIASTGLGIVLQQKDSLTSEKMYQTILMAKNQLKAGKGFNGQNIDECKLKAKELVILDAPIRVCNELESLLKK